MSDNNNIFTVNTPGLAVDKIVAQIRERVAEKLAQGVYADARIARAERLNLANLRADENFLEIYLGSLRDAVTIDINDFPIRERRPWLAPLLVRFKKTIWGLLRFYTYRLWSQQNEVNGLLMTALEVMAEKYGAKIKDLETRIASLEAKLKDRQS